MSKGNAVIPVRFTENLLAWMDEEIEMRNGRTADEPWNRSDFIRAAVIDKLKHRGRSRRTRSSKNSCSNSD